MTALEFAQREGLNSWITLRALSAILERISTHKITDADLIRRALDLSFQHIVSQESRGG